MSEAREREVGAEWAAMFCTTLAGLIEQGVQPDAVDARHLHQTADAIRTLRRHLQEAQERAEMYETELREAWEGVDRYRGLFRKACQEAGELYRAVMDGDMEAAREYCERHTVHLARTEADPS